MLRTGIGVVELVGALSELLTGTGFPSTIVILQFVMPFGLAEG